MEESSMENSFSICQNNGITYESLGNSVSERENDLESVFNQFIKKSS